MIATGECVGNYDWPLWTLNCRVVGLLSGCFGTLLRRNSFDVISNAELPHKAGNKCTAARKLFLLLAFTFIIPFLLWVSSADALRLNCIHMAVRPPVGLTKK